MPFNVVNGNVTKIAYDKANEALITSNSADQKADEAIQSSNEAKQTAQSAETKANSVQDQFNQVVINGDSSVEAAQARVNAAGVTFPTLKERIDNEIGVLQSDLETTNTQLAQTTQELNKIENVLGVSIEDFPRLSLETNDSSRIKRAYDGLGENGGYILFPNGEYIFNLSIMKSNIKLLGMGVNKTIFKPADYTKPLISIGDGYTGLKHTTIENVKLIGNVDAPPTDKPESHGILISGVLYTFLKNVHLEYFGGDNVKIYSPSYSVGTAYVFADNFVSNWAYGSSLNIDKGNSFTTAIYINNFSLQGYTNTGATALKVTKCIVSMVNGWITTKNGVGHVLLSGDYPLVRLMLSNVSIDSNSIEDVLIETLSTASTGATKYMSYYLLGNFTVSGKWKNGNGVVSTEPIEGSTTLSRYSKLNNPHIVNEMYVSSIRSTHPEDRSEAKVFYRDGNRFKHFFSSLFPNGLDLANYVPTPPTASTSSGYTSCWSTDTNYLYICVSDNLWKRISLETW